MNIISLTVKRTIQVTFMLTLCIFFIAWVNAMQTRVEVEMIEVDSLSMISTLLVVAVVSFIIGTLKTDARD